LPDTPHFSFGGMNNDRPPWFGASVFPHPRRLQQTFRHLAEFSQATVFLPALFT